MKKYMIVMTEDRHVTVRCGDNEVDMNVVESIDVKIGTFDEVEEQVPYYTNSYEETQRFYELLSKHGRNTAVDTPYPGESYYKTITVQEI
ncbi:hypothetical protein Ac42p059 [Acinetobacter phage Ac42]|uniref:hypothetical protein n=1 Tax=Acinetobacter phage Ac42 TaxID=762660 RepID=UPI0001EBCC9D|nr:hypothetical protein Ac42p059 [Acinetobacter phage Ac42]ADI96297.1 hypothetical protein Ac42p059 [Acinetobacter phage Ac42]